MRHRRALKISAAWAGYDLFVTPPVVPPVHLKLDVIGAHGGDLCDQYNGHPDDPSRAMELIKHHQRRLQHVI